MATFLYKCPNCGVYDVTEEHFFTYVTAPQVAEIRARIKSSTAVGGRIDFQDCCPKCTINGLMTTSRVYALREKKVV